MSNARRHVAAGLASAGLVAGALAAPAPLLAQGAGASTATTPAAPAFVPDAPPAFVPDTPPAFVPDTSPPPEVVGARPQPASETKEPKPAKPGKPDPEQADGFTAEPGPDVLPTGAGLNRIEVPAFFIDTFGVPPFLLPIYQAAGVEYGIRWEVLAAINEIESDYGRNLNISSAGALGWMQFMPATWEAYGVDANRDGRKDPYNPVDAIFAAARYLKAAGAEKDLSAALFAYNHADWYVRDVLRRAQILAALPTDLVTALSGLAQGRPPVLGPMRIARRASGARRSRTVTVRTSPAARVVAVTDGKVIAIGRNERLGRFLRLRDAHGNTYTYGKLGHVARRYPALAGDAPDLPAALAPGKDPVPTSPATAGEHADAAVAAAAPQDVATAKVQDPAARSAIAPARGASPIDMPPGATLGPAVPAAPLDARPLDLAGSRSPRAATPPPVPAPARANAPLASLERMATAWRTQQDTAARRSTATRKPRQEPVSDYDRALFGDPSTTRVRYRALRAGTRVVAGTVLGHSQSRATTGGAPRVRFEIRPAGRHAPRIDPRPIIAGWKLLATSQQGAGSTPSIGQVLLLGDRALERLVLADRRIKIYRCGRDDIRAGRVDRRVLVTLELLAVSGLDPTVSSLRCGHGRLTSSGNISEHHSGNAVDISAINGKPILGHQGAGSITDDAIRRLLTLQGTVQPHQIISLMTFDEAPNTLAMSDHDDHIHVGFAPEAAPNSLEARSLDGVLGPRQWRRLIARLSKIDNPRVRAIPSRYASKTKRGKP